MTMTQTFQEYKEQADALHTIQLKIVQHCLDLCDTLTERAPNRYTKYAFELDSSGRKYHKIFMTLDGRRDSIHAFIDKKTGDVFKPATAKAPAKIVRFNLLIIKEREEMLSRADWAGSYLYLR